jgi:hypothetical protein
VEHCGLTKFVGGCELNSGGLEQGLVVGLCSVMSEKILVLSLISQQVLKIDLPDSHICHLLDFLFTDML